MLTLRERVGYGERPDSLTVDQVEELIGVRPERNGPRFMPWHSEWVDCVRWAQPPVTLWYWDRWSEEFVRSDLLAKARALIPMRAKL